MKNILSIFVKLKSKFSREIILIIFEKILKIGSHLHSLKDDLDLRLQDRKKDLSVQEIFQNSNNKKHFRNPPHKLYINIYTGWNKIPAPPAGARLECIKNIF